MAKYKDCIIELNYDDVDIISFVNSFEKKSIADKRIKRMIEIVQNGERIQKIYKVPSDYSLPEVEYPVKKRLNLPEELSDFINGVIKELQSSSKRTRGDIVKGIIKEFLDSADAPFLDIALSEYIRNRCKLAVKEIGYVEQKQPVSIDTAEKAGESRSIFKKEDKEELVSNAMLNNEDDILDAAMHKIRINSVNNKDTEIKKTGQTSNQINFRKKFSINNK